MSAELPRDLYDAASTRELDRVAIEQLGIPGLTLMQRAGQAAYEALRERWPEVQRVSVLCGTGNNGGDGFVIAGLAAADDLDVEVIILGDRNRISGDAAACFKALADSAVSVFDWKRDFSNAGVVVDALFGTGLDRDLAGDFFQAVERMNAGGQAILSVDIPSGINATSGRRMGTAVAADLTVTFIGVNQGLLTGNAPAFAGEIVYRDLEVPASAQIVLEGYVEPGERRREGPFGDHTGFYSLADDFPVFHLECITHRRQPIYLTTVVGIPPMEDYYLGKVSERIFLPLIRKTLPEIIDMHFPAEGIFHNLVIVSIDKRYPGHARKIMNAFWGLGQLMFSKVIVVVDKDVDVQNQSEVAWIVGTHIDPERDIQFTRGPVDDLENASPMPALGSKMGIDATRKWASEGFTREWPQRIVTTEEAGRRATQLWARIAKEGR